MKEQTHVDCYEYSESDRVLGSAATWLRVKI